MKKLITLILTVFLAGSISLNYAQQAQVGNKIYNPEANAKDDINKAVKEAKTQGKFVMVQVGGNWCSWCLLFHKFINDDQEIKKFIDENYVFTLLNYSPPDHKNTEILKRFRNPGRMGYPVFLILDGKGELIHTQNSAYLEDGRNYSKAKVMEFLKTWTPAALDPKNVK